MNKLPRKANKKILSHGLKKEKEKRNTNGKLNKYDNIITTGQPRNSYFCLHLIPNLQKDGTHWLSNLNARTSTNSVSTTKTFFSKPCKMQVWNWKERWHQCKFHLQCGFDIIEWVFLYQLLKPVRKMSWHKLDLCNNSIKPDNQQILIEKQWN